MHVMNVIVSTVYVDGLVQEGINSIANEPEKLQSCIRSSTCLCDIVWFLVNHFVGWLRAKFTRPNIDWSWVIVVVSCLNTSRPI